MSKKIWITAAVSLGLSVLALVVSFSKTGTDTVSVVTPMPTNVGNTETISYFPTQFTQGLGFGTPNNAGLNQQTGFIRAGKNQDAWQNTVGRTVYVDMDEMHPIATSTGASIAYASSTLSFYVATSSKSTFPDFIQPNANFLLINGATISTSTEDIREFVLASGTSTGFSASTTVSVLPVKNGEWLVHDIQAKNFCQADTSCGTTATSSFRGYDVQWFMRYHY